MVLPVGMIIQPRAFLLIQLFALLPTLLVVFLLRADFFTQLTNLINMLLCLFVSAYICRITYNMVSENIANTRAIELINIELKELSETDTLTTLLNRRKLNAVLEHEWNRAARCGASLAFVLFDIDYFKYYNDTYGHLKGDECLALIGKTLREKFMRAGEYAARYGGEEFALVLAGYDEEQVVAACERLFAAITDLAIPHKTSKVADVVTLSAGIISAVPQADDNPTDFIEKADTALYQAKLAGRNRYVVVRNSPSC
jgi:diguanylate cyclase (GGDEF)-like protein